MNTEKPDDIELAKSELKSLIDAVNIKLSTDDYTNVPEGKAWVHQMWSGSAIRAQWYLPDGSGTEALGFWFPPDGKGTIGSDMIGDPAEREEPRARAPLPQLHARRQERVLELRELRRLPAAAHEARPGPARRRRGRPGEPEDGDRARERLRPGIRRSPSSPRPARPTGRTPGPSSRRVSEPKRGVGADRAGDGFWAGLALPGVVWLCVFFLLPFYVILCVALGSRRSDLPDAARPSGTRSTGTRRRSSSCSTACSRAAPRSRPCSCGRSSTSSSRRRCRSSSPTRSRTTSPATAAAGRGSCSWGSSRRSSSRTSCACWPGSTCSRTTAG